MMQNEAMNAPQRAVTASLPRVFPRVPVIMVNYPDMTYRVSRANVDSMFNGEHFTLYGATGSVRRYVSAITTIITAKVTVRRVRRSLFWKPAP